MSTCCILYLHNLLKMCSYLLHHSHVLRCFYFLRWIFCHNFDDLFRRWHNYERIFKCIYFTTLYVYPSSKDSQVRMMLSAWRQIFFSSRILTDELALVGTYHCKVSKCSLRLRREEIGLSHKTPVSLQSSKTLQFCNGGTNGSNFFTT